jgi:membrane-associated phospholipid phosphatase
MRNSFRQLSSLNAFITTSLIFILFGAGFLMMNGKVEIHMFINTYHSSFLDVLFKYVTYLGDGITVAVGAVLVSLLTFKKYRYSVAILGAGTLVLAGASSQMLKRLVFDDALRPLGFIGEGKLYLVPGVDVHTANSFPSGHTTAAFAFFAFLAFVMFAKNKLMQIITAIVAVLVGYSRMYLSQHFLEDVVTGAILGLCCFILMALIVRHWRYE